MCSLTVGLVGKEEDCALHLDGPEKKSQRRFPRRRLPDYLSEEDAGGSI